MPTGVTAAPVDKTADEASASRETDGPPHQAHVTQQFASIASDDSAVYVFEAGALVTRGSPIGLLATRQL